LSYLFVFFACGRQYNEYGETDKNNSEESCDKENYYKS